jgi:hypothetical protein
LDASNVIETLLSLITPDPDKLLIWIWIVAVFLIKRLFVIAEMPKEAVTS